MINVHYSSPRKLGRRRTCITASAGLGASLDILFIKLGTTVPVVKSQGAIFLKRSWNSKEFCS
jgi:hypothetical protein